MICTVPSSKLPRRGWTTRQHTPHHENLRWAARRVLSECNASYVISLVKRFREERNDRWGLRARFRNGDFGAGLGLCSLYQPGFGVVGHVELIEHVQRRRVRALVRTLNAFLRNDQLPAAGRSGALRLAGYLADPTLASAIKTSWLADTGRDERLTDYLWASAQCCGEDAAGLLAPVCDKWAALPDKADREHSVSSRNNLAAHEIRWAFRDRVPESAIHYFIEQAKTSALRWPITFMLHGIDHPDAVEFVTRELAATENFSPFAMTAEDEWKRQQEKTGRAMSDASRNRLRELWTNKQNGKHLRNWATGGR